MRIKTPNAAVRFAAIHRITGNKNLSRTTQETAVDLKCRNLSQKYTKNSEVDLPDLNLVNRLSNLTYAMLTQSSTKHLTTMTMYYHPAEKDDEKDQELVHGILLTDEDHNAFWKAQGPLMAAFVKQVEEARKHYVNLREKVIRELFRISHSHGANANSGLVNQAIKANNNELQQANNRFLELTSRFTEVQQTLMKNTDASIPALIEFVRTHQDQDNEYGFPAEEHES